MLLRRELWRRGLRYRLKSKIYGKPDAVFVRARVALFVDGCFWHGCPEHSVQPKTNAKFWIEKIARNRTRDLLVAEQLTAEGWTVIRVWEHSVRKDLQSCAAVVEAAVRA